MQIQHSTQHSKKTLFASLPLLISLLTITTPFSSAFADTEYQVQSGDSLSKIVAKNYPDVARQSYGIIMQHILKNNPDAFANKNINSLRLGKTLTLTAKEYIEGLKPKPPAPVPVNPEEFKKLQLQNSELEKQLQVAKRELEKLQNASTQSATTGDTETAEKSTTQEDTTALKEKIDQLSAQVKQLESEKQTLEAKTTNSNEQDTKLTEANALVEQLQAQITSLKAENSELSKVDVTTIEKQLADAKAESTELKKQLETLKTEQAKQAKANDELSAANKQIETLQSKIEQLNTQISTLETEKDNKDQTSSSDANKPDTNKLEELQAQVTFLQGLADKNEADMDEKDAQIKQLEEKVAMLGGTTAGSEDNNAVATDTAQLEALKEENSQLQTEINKAIEKANQDSNTIKQLKADLAAATAAKPVPSTSPQAPATSPAAEAEKTSEPSTWLKLSILSWLLPLLAILIGLYLLSRLIKRKRDQQATENFKTAMATSASSNTASAFGIDGSAPAPNVASDSENSEQVVEEDSLEAGVKIDIAKAYLDLNETEAANEMLQEAMIEGSRSQKEAAEKLLK